MAALRRAGDMCAGEDARAAESLYRDGVVPDAEFSREEVCIEADGTWFSVQRPAPGEPRRFEVKAMCAYAGKEERGGRVRRTEVFHHALVGRPEELWTQAVAQMGRLFDLPAIKTVHLGADGEPWCSDAGRYLPRAEVVAHLDPYHANRAVLSCAADRELAGRILGALRDDGAGPAAALLRAASSAGLAGRAAERVAGYLERNAGAIGVGGPTLGTMESDNQHIYGARMDSVPCAWSVEGARTWPESCPEEPRGAPSPAWTGINRCPGANARRERRGCWRRSGEKDRGVC